MEEIQKTCYVCFEECHDLSKCNCKDIYIHKTCQADTITNLNSTQCSICKAEYTNLIVVNKRLAQPNKNFYNFIMLLFTFTFMATVCMSEVLIGFYIMHNYRDERFITAYVFLLISTSMYTLILKIRLLVYVREMCLRRIRLIDYDPIITSVTLM